MAHRLVNWRAAAKWHRGIYILPKRMVVYQRERWSFPGFMSSNATGNVFSFSHNQVQSRRPNLSRWFFLVRFILVTRRFTVLGLSARSQRKTIQNSYFRPKTLRLVKVYRLPIRHASRRGFVWNG